MRNNRCLRGEDNFLKVHHDQIGPFGTSLKPLYPSGPQGLFMTRYEPSVTLRTHQPHRTLQDHSEPLCTLLDPSGPIWTTLIRTLKDTSGPIRTPQGPWSPSGSHITIGSGVYKLTIVVTDFCSSFFLLRLLLLTPYFGIK